MKRPSSRTARLAAWSAVPLAFLASAGLVATSSYSAFSSQTSNATNNWAAGTVNLTDDDSNTALFSATGLKPGDTGSKCIAVTSTGTVASTVKLFGTSPATTNALSTHLTLTVTQGTGGSFGSCTGFTPLSTGSSVYAGSLAGFGGAATSYATGLGTWAPTGTGSETRVFKFDYTFNNSAPNSTQGGTAAIGFTWEAQS
ncbi:MAG: TasA family protein [Dermatophilaceae bacterium]